MNRWQPDPDTVDDHATRDGILTGAALVLIGYILRGVIQGGFEVVAVVGIVTLATVCVAICERGDW